MYCITYLNFDLVIDSIRTNIHFYFVFSIIILTNVSMYATVIFSKKKKSIGFIIYYMNYHHIYRLLGLLMKHLHRL